MQAGTGISGVVIPFCLNFLLDTYGSQKTLRIWSVVTLLFTPMAYFIRPRTRMLASRTPWRRGAGFVRAPIFWILIVCFLIQSLGFPIPAVFLPKFAVSLGYSVAIGTLFLVLFNVSSVVSTIVFGALTDRYDVANVLLSLALGSIIAVFAFWGTSDGLPMTVIFCLTYGFFAGGVSCTACSGVIRRLRVYGEMDAGLLLSLIMAARGVGIVSSGPISEALYALKSWEGEARLAYGSGYGPLIVFTGVTASFSALPWIVKVLGWVK